jgi:hypothetical protein
MMMKKTVAGVLAGAVAVSAMAATVSADQDTITLTYDLKTYIQDIGYGSVQYVAKWADSTEGNEYIIPTSALSENGGAGLQFNLTDVKKDLQGNSLLGDGDKSAYAVELSVKALTNTSDKQASKTISDSFKFYNVAASGTENPFKNSNDWIAVNGAPVFHTGADENLVTIPVYAQTGETSFGAYIKPYELATLGYSGDGYGFSSITVRIWYKTRAQVAWDGRSTWSYNNPSDEVYNFIWNEVNGTGTLGYNTTWYQKDKAPEITDYTATFSSNLSVYPATKGFASLSNGEITEKVYPFRTNLKATNYTNAEKLGDVVLRTDDVLYNIKQRKSGGNYYTNPVAVINDAIANHEQVTFTFTGYDNYVATANSHILQQWVEPYRAYGWSTGKADWYAPTFGQHVYATDYNVLTPYSDTLTSGVNVKSGYTAQAANPSAYDMYGSYSQAWAVNLFTGALVINSELTMQLSDTDKFQWGTNTLSFDWFTLTDEGKISDAKTFLTSMLLYTPTDWYWDSLTVEVGGESEEVDNGAGLEQDEDVIEEEIEEEVIEEEPVEEEVVEEVEEEVVEEAPVAPAPSPATGNAPVALAVIPVALAAAAVVAKKRG